MTLSKKIEYLIEKGWVEDKEFPYCERRSLGNKHWLLHNDIVYTGKFTEAAYNFQLMLENTVKESKYHELTNESLLQTVLNLAQGDDYEGCFTEKGQIEYSLAYKELYSRLQWINFV